MCSFAGAGARAVGGRWGGTDAWLGAAVAIKEPTVATFARHAGQQLMVVGAWDESALGVLTNAVVALAAQNPVRSRGSRIEERDGI